MHAKLHNTNLITHAQYTQLGQVFESREGGREGGRKEGKEGEGQWKGGREEIERIYDQISFTIHAL